MASHLVVIAASARRHTVKTTPGKYLSDVLQEACHKFGLDPDQHGLKHNSKQVDLSRTVRLSGLSSGAKLDLVQASRSPSVVAIALQLPTQGEASGSFARLTDKVPSNISLWQILRRFESGFTGAEESAGNHNFTQRATAHIADGVSGAGRLTYEMPLIHVMGRDLTSFTDLQKTLAQLGINNGSALLRLTYRDSQQPMEEAMATISKYFSSLEEATIPKQGQGAHSGAPNDLHSIPDVDSEKKPEYADDEKSDPIEQVVETTLSKADLVQGATLDSTANLAPDKLSIFAPPSSSTPMAASSTAYDESDYVPTVDHAKQHQSRLNLESRNRKLKSDAELVEQERVRVAALQEVREVTVRLRFPDQSQVQRDFGPQATTGDLYKLCKELMSRPGDEAFSLRIFGSKGLPSLLEESNQQLIGSLGWQGRVLVTVAWGDDVTQEMRSRPSLKEEYRQRAEQLHIDSALPEPVVETRPEVVEQGTEKRKESSSGEVKEARMKRLLKGLTKK